MYGGNNAGGFGGFGGFGGGGFGGGDGGFMGGGGFFPSPKKNPGNPFSPTNKGGAGLREPSARDLQGLVSATVKMVIEAAAQADGIEANVIRLHGNHEASLVELVGQVESVDESEQMFAKYVIDDGTGKIVCKRFMDADKVVRDSRVAVGKFVRVIGPFRRFGAENYINAHKVEEVRSLDEIARHRIEVVYTFLQLTGQLDPSGSPATSAAVSGLSASMSSASADYPIMYPPHQQQQQQYQPPSYQQQPPQQQYQQQPTYPNQGSVGSHEWFHTELQRVFGPRGPRFNPNEGVTRQQLYIHFLASMTNKQVDERIQSLQNEGQLYCLRDDDHFQLSGG